MKHIGIIGATGYTGSELVRLFNDHPQVQVDLITSESYKGYKFSDIHPQFRAIAEYTLQSAEEADLQGLDAVFLALPHGVSMEYVKRWANKGVRLIDLSGDFRLSSVETYESWYGKDHIYPEGFKQAVFGLPELYRQKIRGASLVANPGCFPTGAILSLMPLLKENLAEPRSLIVDSKTGVTGAGIKPKTLSHFPNLNDNFKAYGLKGHRHTIEIQEVLAEVAGKEAVVQFTPHLLPVDRGILSTSYARPQKPVRESEVQNLYRRYYEDEPFVRILNELPQIKHVRGTNYVDIYVTYDSRTNNIISISAIDNLVKGAAGQAIQNMNLMLGLEETAGLKQVPLQP